MLDELALALGGPAGMLVAGGSGVEIGNLRRGDDVRDFAYNFELCGHFVLSQVEEDEPAISSEGL
jgi:hypothetical protein